MLLIFSSFSIMKVLKLLSVELELIDLLKGWVIFYKLALESFFWVTFEMDCADLGKSL